MLLESDDDFNFINALPVLPKGTIATSPKLKDSFVYDIRSSDNADEARRIKLYQLAGIKEKETISSSNRVNKLKKIN